MVELPFDGIVVGIPARDEQDRITECVRSVVGAAEHVSQEVVVVVAVDRSSDRTADQVRTALDEAGRSVLGAVITCDHGSAGAARATAIEHALQLTSAPMPRCWVATTDADTVVASDWLRTHVRWAQQGAEGIAGLVDVRWEGGPPSLPAAYRAAIEAGGTAFGHRHVHGANLGLRADRWRQVGGCGSSVLGEDHELWQRLRDQGARLLGVDDLRVRTSGRLHGRSAGGFADLLQELVSSGE